MSVFLPRSVLKQVRKLTVKDKEKITGKLEQLSNNKYIGIDLQGELNGYYKIKMPPFRIIYRLEKNTIYIVAADFRENIYKKLKRDI
jgi:mRNA-degrading endonuclease RelE of RelBE toxin-antitoxin system